MMHEIAFGKVFAGGVLFFALAACSEDAADPDAPGGQGSGATSGPSSSGPNTASLPALPGGGDDDEDERFDSCKDYDFRPYPNRAKPTGSAHVSLPATSNLAAVDIDLSEVVCETLHDVTGKVAGIGLSFFSTWESAVATPAYARLRWEGAFTGDGMYTGASFLYSAERASSSAFRDEQSLTGTLTVTEGGRVGSFSGASGDTLLSFSCGSAEKLSTAVKPPAATVPPGTLRIWGDDGGPVYEFTGVQCGTEASDDFVIIDEFTAPYSVRILLDGNGTGRHRTDDFLLRYAGLTNHTSGGYVELECGFPSRGTIEFGDVGNPNFSGIFTCPD